jgi:hypothetical protein
MLVKPSAPLLLLLLLLSLAPCCGTCHCSDSGWLGL